MKSTLKKVRRLGRPLKYGGLRYQCPVCEGRFRRWLYSAATDYEDVCPRCESWVRHRHVWLYLQRHTNLFSTPLRLLHISPEHCYKPRLLRQGNLTYVTSDLQGGKEALSIDLTRVEYPANSFDAIICMHVLEHIRDDIGAIRGLRHLLRPGGWGVIQVPISGTTTDEDPAIVSPDDRAARFGQHDHVRYYGRDFRDRLEAGGFEVRVDTFRDELPLEERERYGLRHHWMTKRWGQAVDIDHDDLHDVYRCTKRREELPADRPGLEGRARAGLGSPRRGASPAGRPR